MNNVQALWQMADEMAELTRRIERRVDWAEDLIAEAQVAASKASDLQEQFVDLLNKVLTEGMCDGCESQKRRN